MELLQGQRSRDAGRVSVLASAGRRRRSRVGVVRQDESAPAELTVREAMAHLARSCPRPGDATDAIAMVGLQQYADTRTGRTSGSRRSPAVGGAARTRHSAARSPRSVPARRTARAQRNRWIRPVSAGSRRPARRARPAAARPTPCP
ncbi:hypothetical protein ACNPQM_26505 [Streptomyces sp. NPDC056231]|uniref:hypothetical protein n=1 Tax=Streptomyces sp. NPDC056231 TaxID=3345755 RepID=UPI003AAECE80